jgi:hypothetical protein
MRLTRSLLIVTSLQKKRDIKALNIIRKFKKELNWEPLSSFLIDEKVWAYAIDQKGYDPKKVFCHPDVLLNNSKAIIYYRGLCGLSLKAAKDYLGSIESLEEGKGKLGPEKALKIARIFNTFISSIIKNSTKWTIKNGYRTIIATLGITLDGVMRNNIGTLAEDRIRAMVIEWIGDNSLFLLPQIEGETLLDTTKIFKIKDNIIMKFSSEPDISFIRDDQLLAVIEIKGGTDPAGALERYGAAKKSFESAIQKSPRCENFYLSAVFTKELIDRIERDRLVHKRFDIIELLDDPTAREKFFRELFHHTLRAIS